MNESGQVRLLLPHNSPHRASLIKSIQLKMSAQLEDFLLELPWEIKRDGYYVYPTNDRIMVRDLYLAPESLTPTENAIIDAALAIGDLKHMQRGHIAEANIINEEYASTIKQQEARHRARQKSAFSLQERDIPFPVISSEEPPRSPDPKIPQNAVTLTGKGALFTALCDKYNLSGEFGGRVNVRDHYDETYGKSYPKENQR